MQKLSESILKNRTSSLCIENKKNTVYQYINVKN